MNRSSNRALLRVRCAAAALCSLLLVSACAADVSGRTGAPENVGGTSDLSWALGYTGGTEKAASGQPIKIGWVNGEGGVWSFPDTTVAADAAVEFVNKKLGGLGGRPIELVKCFVDTPEAGRRCASEMINAAVPLVVWGVAAAGNAEFFGALGGRIPTLVGVAITAPDLTGKNAFSYGPTSPVTLSGLVKFTGGLAPAGHKVVATAIDAPAGRYGLDNYIVPGLKAAGLDVTAVALPSDATGPQMATALTSAGLADADVLVSSAALSTCAPMYDAIQQIASKRLQVIDTGGCIDAAFTQYLADRGVKGDFPDGWYFSGPAYSPLLPTDKGGVNTYLQGLKDYAPKNVNFFSPFTQYGFAAAFSIPAILNKVAGDLTPVTVLSALKSFDKEYMMTSGKPECGREASAPAACSFTSGITQYKDGKFEPVRMGNNDNPMVIEKLAGS